MDSLIRTGQEFYNNGWIFEDQTASKILREMKAGFLTVPKGISDTGDGQPGRAAQPMRPEPQVTAPHPILYTGGAGVCGSVTSHCYKYVESLPYSRVPAERWRCGGCKDSPFGNMVIIHSGKNQ